MSSSVWKYVSERGCAEQDAELYSEVAELYHNFRPRYPEQLIEEATATLPKHANILEIGSGPGTATLPLLQRGFQVTCVEPSSGMMKKAKQVCREYSNQVTFRQVTLGEFLEQTKKEECSFDAIVAATSFHWAMDSEGIIVKKCHGLLKPGGKLLLMWNLPSEPSEAVRNTVATANNHSVPFYFGGYSIEEHKHNLHDKILDPVEATNLFSDFTLLQYPTVTKMTITDYLAMVRTFSLYIRMTDDDRESFFETTQKIMAEMCGATNTVETTGLSLLNVATKLDDEQERMSGKVQQKQM